MPSSTAGTLKKQPPSWRSMLNYFVEYIYLTFVRPMIKCPTCGCVHVATNTCEIERVVKQAERGCYASVVLDLERSLLLSRSPDLRGLPQVPPTAIDDAMQVIVRQKAIERHAFMQIQRPLRACLLSLLGYNALVREVEKQRAEQFDANCDEHLMKLQELWCLLEPNTTYPGSTGKHWQAVGFQGGNPATDFRGMGVLGLDQLIYLLRKHNKAAHSLLSLSHHPTVGFPFCIAAISITALARDLLREGHLRTHMWNSYAEAPTINDFHKTYFQLFSLYITVWRNSEATSVMEFDRRKAVFANDIIIYLSDPTAKLPPGLC